MNERGVFPILLFVAIGVALVAGGTYAVKNNLVTTKNGQIVFNANKDKNLSDAKIPIPTTKKADLAQNSAEYIPETGEPKFSITPPAGWVKVNKEGKVKVFYEASQEDKKVVGNSTSRSTANIEITSEKSSAKDLDEVMAKTKKEAGNSTVKVEFSNEQKTTFAGYDAIRYEATVGFADMSDAQIEAELKKAGNNSSVQDIKDLIKAKVKGLGYVLIKDGYEIGVGGTALGSAWDKRGPQIESSINSFKFIDETASYAAWSTPPKYSLNLSKTWKKTVYPRNGGNSTTMYESSKNPDVKIYIELIESPGDTYEEVIKKFKYERKSPFPKTINGLEGYIAEYEDYQLNASRHLEFMSFKKGFKIYIRADAPGKDWPIYEEGFKKAVDSFKLE